MHNGMIEVLAIARCGRCNIVSTAIKPTRHGTPDYVSVSLPSDWMSVRVFADGEEDYILCPECRITAYDWLQDTVTRLSTSEEEKRVLDKLEDILYPMDETRGTQWNGGDVCDDVAALLRLYRPNAFFRQPEGD